MPIMQNIIVMVKTIPTEIRPLLPAMFVEFISNLAFSFCLSSVLILTFIKLLRVNLHLKAKSSGKSTISNDWCILVQILVHFKNE